MYTASRHLRVLGTFLAFGILAGCAAETATTPQPPVTMAPQLAGAWYQVYFDSDKFDIDARGNMIVDRVAYVAKNNAIIYLTEVAG